VPCLLNRSFTLTNSGGAATGPLTVTLTGPAAFADTGNACAAASLGPGQTCNVTVGFTPAAEGAMTATLTAASTNPVATATDALSGTMAPAIYWANAGDHTSGAGAIWMANLDGTSPHAIATGQDDPAGVAVDASHLYWANTDDNAIVEVGLDGSSPHTIVTGALAPELQGGVAVNAGHLYWDDLNQGAIAEANLDGSNPHTIIVTGQNAPEGVAVAGQLYWSDVLTGAAGTGRVGEANLDGSSPHLIVTGQDVPQMMAVTPVGPELDCPGQPIRRSRHGWCPPPGWRAVTCANPLLDAALWFAPRAGPSSATCPRRKTTLPPGLLPNGPKITA
jgi:hypothetical protein